ncbi:MAG: quinolinate synthase NadA [Actinobacteria bacterium]|jgi:quinolinate synthase|nr:quinolinate synthase NadA [Actinomycetota bacterium]
MIRIQSPLGESYTNASLDDLDARIGMARQRLGDSVLILGHHYQRDEVMKWADARGDSLALSRFASASDTAKYIVFCGVHFMAEAADIITRPDQQVILPDLNAGCSMADMADTEDVEAAWNDFSQVTDIDRIVPITYINSAASLKNFVGRHGGSVCTSSNARAVLSWALQLDRTGGPDRGRKVLFVPDQHLGRNTAYQLGYAATDMALYDPRMDYGGLDEQTVKERSILLWKGHCSVHQRFTVDQVNAFRQQNPEGIVVVHPECPHEVVELADAVGSTDFIIKTINEAPEGTAIAVGTEIHLVNRLGNEHPEKRVISLDPLICPCSTMFRIDPPHLCWILEGLVDGEVRNRITVDEDVADGARIALDRMLSIS